MVVTVGAYARAVWLWGAIELAVARGEAAARAYGGRCGCCCC